MCLRVSEGKEACERTSQTAQPSLGKKKERKKKDRRHQSSRGWIARGQAESRVENRREEFGGQVAQLGRDGIG